MSFTRRRLLGLIAALPFVAACDLFASPLTKKMKGFAMQPISPEEIELLKNPLTRPACFASHKLPQGVLEIRQRVFGAERGLLRGADLKDVRFINCSFEGFQGYDNNLDNVIFEECQFFGGVFTGDQWQKVRLLRCEAEGPFKIGCADGELVCEECKFRGLTSEEGGGLGGWSAHFGLVTASDGSMSFQRCQLVNVGTSGGRLLRLAECEIKDLSGGIDSKKGMLEVITTRAKGKLDFSGSDGFSRITIKDSQLGEVDLMGASSDVVEIVGSSVSLKMGAFGTRFGEIRLHKTTFHSEGFNCVLSTFRSLTIEDCTFAVQSKGLQLFGKPNPNPPSPGRGPVYWTRADDVTIRNTTIPRAGLTYMQIGSFALENSTLGDADLTHGRIGTLSFRQAKLTGSVDLTDTTIRRIENSGLTNTARITGELIARPDAPEPDLQPERKAEAKNGGKKKPTK